MLARKNIIHPTLYMVDAVISQFVPFWMVTGITGGLIVATTIAYRDELYRAYVHVKTWLVPRKPNNSSDDTSGDTYRKDSFAI